MTLYVPIVSLERENCIKNNWLRLMNLKCVSRDYGLNVNGVRGVYIKMSFAHRRIVLFIIGGLRRRRILLVVFLYWSDSIWNGKPAGRHHGKYDGQIQKCSIMEVD